MRTRSFGYNGVSDDAALGCVGRMKRIRGWWRKTKYSYISIHEMSRKYPGLGSFDS